MKFKILPDSPLFASLQELKVKINAATDAAIDLQEELGGVAHCSDPWAKSGGISAIKFDVKPEGWKQAGRNYDNDCYFPRKNSQNKEVLSRIEALPKVTHHDVNEIIGFNQHTNAGRFFFSPGFFITDDIVLMNISEDANYSPIAGMIEITVSEFNLLLAEAKSEKKKKGTKEIVAQ